MMARNTPVSAPASNQDNFSDWRLRVLVVEDDPDTALTLSQLLAVYGFEVHVENDGAAAVAWALDNHPDVILLDIGLPNGLDGYEVARRLVAQATDKPPLLIALTGRGQDDDVRRSREAGIHLHLVKPVEPEKLHQLLLRFQRVVMPGSAPQ